MNTLIPNSVNDLQKSCYNTREKNKDEGDNKFIEIADNKLQFYNQWLNGNCSQVLARMEKKSFL